jgi:cell division protein FtsQ
MPDDIRTGSPEVDPRHVVVLPEAAPIAAIPPAGPPPAQRPPHVASRARRRALMPWAVIAALVVVLGAGGVSLTYSPLFHAKTITVSGAHRLSEQRILKIAGIGPGTNVFHLDLGSIERRLERNPWIAKAVVSRHLPSSIFVVISERRPVALTQLADGAFSYLAVDGSVLAPAPRTSTLPLVKTTVLGAAARSAMATGASVAQALPPALLPEVASISVDAEGSVTLQLRSGVTATYGDGSQPELKGEALKAILEYATRNAKVLISIDVEVPGAPTAVFTDTVVTLHPATPPSSPASSPTGSPSSSPTASPTPAR